jgi:DNA-binding phage protein
MTEKFTKYDTAEHLKTDADMAAYLDACLEELARDTGLARENLYKALSIDGNPEFGTILKVIKALGLKLHAESA